MQLRAVTSLRRHVATLKIFRDEEIYFRIFESGPASPERNSVVNHIRDSRQTIIKSGTHASQRDLASTYVWTWGRWEVQTRRKWVIRGPRSPLRPSGWFQKRYKEPDAKWAINCTRRFLRPALTTSTNGGFSLNLPCFDDSLVLLPFAVSRGMLSRECNFLSLSFPFPFRVEFFKCLFLVTASVNFFQLSLISFI